MRNQACAGTSRMLTVLILAPLFFVRPAFGQCDTPLDSVLCAPQLSAAQAATFSAGDSVLSPFWPSPADDTWDYLTLVPPDNCWQHQRCEFSGADDAQVTVRAAYADDGLYLLCLVRDDDRTECPDTSRYWVEALELYFDTLSSSELWDWYQELPAGIGAAVLSYASCIYSLCLGETSPPNSLRMGYGDDSLWVMRFESLTAGELRTRFGVEYEMVLCDTNLTGLEMFIPWAWYFNHAPESTYAAYQLEGRLIAFTCGYNDSDSHESEVNTLAWLGGLPWAIGVNHWGDILLSGEPAASVAGEPMPKRSGGRAAVQEPPLRVKSNVRHGSSPVIAYSLAEPARVELDILDVKGARVGRLVDGVLPSGTYQACLPYPFSPGMYLVRLRSGADVAVLRVVIGRR